MSAPAGPDARGADTRPRDASGTAETTGASGATDASGASRTTGRWPTSLVLAAAALLGLPRLLRLLAPRVWIESAEYLNNALLLGRGLRPYVDFPHPHFPVLEALLAAVFAAAGASIRTAEALTAAAVLASAVLLLELGRRLHSTTCGLLAATAYSWSYVTFRYHVFEREPYVNVVVLLVALLCAGDRRPRGLPRGPAGDATGRRGIAGDGVRRAALGGLLLAIGAAFKLTAGFYLPALLAYLGLVRRRADAAARLLGAFVLAFGTIGAACLALYGRPFLIQTFLFRIVHGEAPLAAKLRLLANVLDVNLALAVVGLAVVVATGAVARFALPLLLLAASFVSLVVLNHTFWPHNGIELLPWLSLPAGYAGAEALRLARDLGARERRAGAALRLGAGAAAVVLLCRYAFPVSIGDWGFGYRDRTEIQQAAAFVRAHAGTDDPVFVPEIVAFAAGRREVVPYTEIAGTVIELENSVRRVGFLGTLHDPDLRGRSFSENVVRSRRRWIGTVERAIREGRLPVIVNPAPGDRAPFRLAAIDEAFLAAQGYALGTRDPELSRLDEGRIEHANRADEPRQAMSTDPRDVAARLAAAGSPRALAAARTAEEPWDRTQALGWVARFAAGDPASCGLDG